MRDTNDLLDRPLIAVDGKEVITVEELLRRELKHPERGSTTLRLSATTILSLLGVDRPGIHLARRATNWLRSNGYVAVGHGKIFKVVMGNAQASPYHVV